MSKSLIVFRIFLVLATAVFMAFHTQIFISRIEPNYIFSWTASLVIEGFLISLALSRTLISRILLIPLFCISVVAASASFIVQNERLLDQFFTQKRVVEQLKTDLSETQKAYQYGQRYTTKTLQRERQLQDELRAILKNQNGDITLVNSLIFLVLVLIMQSVSIYTAATLKNGKFQKPPAEISETENDVSEIVSERFRVLKRPETTETDFETAETDLEMSETTETKSETKSETLKQVSELSETDFEKGKNPLDRDGIIAELKRLKSKTTFDEMSRMFGVSKATLSRIISTGGEGISEEIFKKISEKI